MSLLGNIPGCITNYPQALYDTSMEVGLTATSMAFNKMPYIADAMGNIGWKSIWWTQYDAYAAARKNCSFYPHYDRISIGDAFLSPFNPAVLSRKEVWIPILAGSMLAIGSEFTGSMENAVWNTGKAYLGNKEVPVLVGVGTTVLLTGFSMTFTAIGEEALFRGVGYEEFKLNYGPFAASLLDAVLFSSVHIPQEILAGMDISGVLVNFAVRAGISLVLEWIYNHGGLKSSIAFHMWFNTIGSIAHYLFTGGKSPDDTSVGNSGSSSMKIGLMPEGLTLSFSFNF